MHFQHNSTAPLHSKHWGRGSTTHIRPVPSSISIIKLSRNLWKCKRAQTTLTRWRWHPSFKKMVTFTHSWMNHFRSYWNKRSVVCFCISNTNWFAWWFPVINEWITRHFCWGCRAWRFPIMRGRFIVNEWTLATTIFRWRWCNRQCIWVLLLPSNGWRWHVGRFFRLERTHGC